jgi:hypothetical protein
MLMRASYGMQIGAGTYNFLPAVWYTGNLEKWSWGAGYRDCQRMSCCYRKGGCLSCSRVHKLKSILWGGPGSRATLQ